MKTLDFNPKKILVVNIFGIGDVLFTTPILSNLKAHYPDVEIGYLCNQRTESIIKANAHVSKVFVYERDEFEEIKQKSKIDFCKKIMAFIHIIKKEKYDAAIDVSMSCFMGFICFMAGIKMRIGFNYKNRGYFLNRKILLQGYENKHVVEYYLDLLRAIDIPVKSKKMEIYIDKDSDVWADKYLRDNGLEKSKIIGLIPGGGGSWGKDAFYKRWAPEKYAKLADNLIEKFSASLILMGDDSERELCQKVASLMKHKVFIATGKTTISQFSALTQKCSLNVLNDGGPLHIAVASQSKTVSIFGPVNENVYGPYPQAYHKVVTSSVCCRPCYRRFRRASCDHLSCLNQISVEDVLRAVEEVYES